MVACSSTLPVASTTATFTPVRKPGSSPIVACCPAGAANNKAFKLRAKTLMASCSARSRKLLINSLSRCIKILTRQHQRTVSTSHLSAGRFWLLILKAWAIFDSHGFKGASHFGFSASVSRRKTTCKISSRRPRKMAKARCDGMLIIVSAYAK